MIDSTHVVLAAIGDGSLSGHFKVIDWVVMLGYLGLVSVLGVLLAGKQTNMEDFFRGGNKLPWYAVSASLIATTISAVTFVGVPSIAFNPDGGNMTYLQLGLIAGLISRLFITYILVPAYYERKIYSPYDYMGNKLGGGARGVTTALFTLGGLLAQSARVYLTALVLEIVLHDQLVALHELTGVSPFAASIILIGLIAVAWTMLGGIATVVWTDAMLFLVFVTGGIAAIWVVVVNLDGGAAELIRVGSENAKFEVFNFKKAFDLTENYTLAAAGFAVVIGNIGAYGTDQLLAQRIFCCKSQKHAKWAMLSSYSAEAVTFLMLLVGVGLFVFYSANPEKLTGVGAQMVAEENDKIFPVFILTEMPVGVTGLVIAGIFAAAVSSLTSILAALAQTSVSAVYLPWRAKKLGVAATDEEQLVAADPSEGKRIVGVSRLLIVFWGVMLCIAAFGVSAYKESTSVPILDLALALASYIVGGLFAAFMLAWLPMKINGRGLVWSAPLGVLAVVATKFHEPWTLWALGGGCTFLLAAWVFAALRHSTDRRGVRLAKTPILAVGCGLVMLMCWQGYFTSTDPDTGDVVMAYPDIVDPETGQRVLDPTAETIYLKHPITQELLLDADGQQIAAADKKQTALKDTSAGRPAPRTIAWPWYAPIGGIIAFVFGWLLADPREADPAIETI